MVGAPAPLINELRWCCFALEESMNIPHLSLYWKHKNTAHVLNILHIYLIAVFAEDYIIITNLKGLI